MDKVCENEVLGRVYHIMELARELEDYRYCYTTIVDDELEVITEHLQYIINELA